MYYLNSQVTVKSNPLKPTAGRSGGLKDGSTSSPSSIILSEVEGRSARFVI